MRVDSILTVVSSVDRKTYKKCIEKFHLRNLEILDLNDTRDKIQQYMDFIVKLCDFIVWLELNIRYVIYPTVKLDQRTYVLLLLAIVY